MVYTFLHESGAEPETRKNIQQEVTREIPTNRGKEGKYLQD
jgi:hypothetical protein